MAIPLTLVKTLAKNLFKNLANICAKNLAKNMVGHIRKAGKRKGRLATGPSRRLSLAKENKKGPHKKTERERLGGLFGPFKGL